MKKIMIFMLVNISICSFSNKKDKQELKLPNIEIQMEKDAKIESYRSKKDLAWHKTEYNKVIKYKKKKKR